MESTPGDGAVKTVEMTTRDLEYCINLVDNVAAGFGRIDSSSERSAAVGKALSNSTTCNSTICEEVISGQTLLLFYFKKLPQTPLTSSNHHPDGSAARNTEARPPTSEKILTH